MDWLYIGLFSDISTIIYIDITTLFGHTLLLSLFSKQTTTLFLVSGALIFQLSTHQPWIGRDTVWNGHENENGCIIYLPSMLCMKGIPSHTSNIKSNDLLRESHAKSLLLREIMCNKKYGWLQRWIMNCSSTRKQLQFNLHLRSNQCWLTSCCRLVITSTANEGMKHLKCLNRIGANKIIHQAR